MIYNEMYNEWGRRHAGFNPSFAVALRSVKSRQSLKNKDISAIRGLMRRYRKSCILFDRKITYIRGSTIEHMKKVKELCIEFNCEVKVLTGDSDYKVRLLGIILMVLVCLAVLFCTCVIILIMYGYLYFMLGILLY